MEISKVTKLEKKFPQCDITTNTGNFYIKVGNRYILVHNSPAVVCWSEFTDYPANSICLKSFVTSNKNCLSSEEDIEAKYGDRPDMAVKLKYCLELAHSIPSGEAWQGDCLYSKNDLKEVEIGDTNYLTFQPNKIVYAFSEDNPTYEVIKNSDFGICFHTIYKGNLEHKTQAFNVDASNLNNVPSDIYVMSPALDTDDVSYDIASIQSQYDELKNLEAKMISDSAYEELVNNKVFMDYWNTFENANLSDKKATNINTETFIDDLKAYISDKIQAKGYKKLETTEEKIKYFSDFIDANTNTLRNLVALLNKASDIKMTLWNSLKNAKQNYSTFYKHREQGYIPANMEGAAFSDQNGNIVKIVDRSSFSSINRNTDYLSGFEHEGLDMKVVKESLLPRTGIGWFDNAYDKMSDDEKSKIEHIIHNVFYIKDDELPLVDEETLEEIFDRFADMNVRKATNESKSYNGYKIKQDHIHGGFNIYDENGELEDYGFKSEEDAMKEVDKMIKRNSLEEASKLEVITANKKAYKEVENYIEKLPNSLEKDIYKYLILNWLKGHNWLGGLSDYEADEVMDYFDNIITSKFDSDGNFLESLEEDTVKTSDGKWTNKGKEGTHGKFNTKKAADAQRKAMFANGYHESMSRTNPIDSDYDDSHKPWPEVKKELIKKYEDKGYKNVSVIRGKTDTKGLRTYIVYGDKIEESYCEELDTEELDAFEEEFNKDDNTFSSVIINK